MTEASPFSSGRAFCRTEVNLVHDSFTWEIKNFRFRCPEGAFRDLTSDVMYCGPRSMYSWQLKLHSRNSPPILYLAILPGLNVKYAEVICALHNPSNGKQYKFTRCLTRPTKKQAKDEQWSEIEEITKSYTFLEGDALKIVFEATVSHSTSSTFIQTFDVPLKGTPASFTDSLTNFLDSERFSDFTIEVDGRKFFAHKIVLAANSEVFNAMLDHDLVENRSGRVLIKDFDIPTVESLLQYMYTHDPPRITSFASLVKVYEIADKYGVSGLKEWCKHQVILILSESNVAELLGLAEKYNDEVLKDEALHFIQEHPSVNLRPPTEWLPLLVWNKVKRVPKWIADYFKFNMLRQLPQNELQYSLQEIVSHNSEPQ